MRELIADVYAPSSRARRPYRRTGPMGAPGQERAASVGIRLLPARFAQMLA